MSLSPSCRQMDTLKRQTQHQIWVDADACPKVSRDILCRAALRTTTTVVFISNHSLSVPKSIYITNILVGKGFDKADDYITARVSAGDLVITADVPLAQAIIEKGGGVLDPRGRVYSDDNIKERIAIRDVAQTLREGRLLHGGPQPYGTKQRQKFANELDKWLRQSGTC